MKTSPQAVLDKHVFGRPASEFQSEESARPIPFPAFEGLTFREMGALYLLGRMVSPGKPVPPPQTQEWQKYAKSAVEGINSLAEELGK